MLLTQEMVENFLGRIKENFPNFIAGVLTDELGFPIASSISKKTPIKENHLALSAVCETDFLDFSNYVKIVREIGKNEKVKLLILLEKSSKYLHKFKRLNKILAKQSLF
jgi:hypothetical protein